MMTAVEKLKEHGIKTAVLTNNWKMKQGSVWFKEAKMFDQERIV